jgi:hypothetical protein
MGQQATSAFVAGLVPVRPEHHVPAHRIGEGIHSSGRFRCSAIGVNADAAEVLSEPILEKRLRARVERSALRPQYLVNNRRGLLRRTVRGRRTV